jgi:hypothetical protein
MADPSVASNLAQPGQDCQSPRSDPVGQASAAPILPCGSGGNASGHTACRRDPEPMGSV